MFLKCKSKLQLHFGKPERAYRTGECLIYTGILFNFLFFTIFILLRCVAEADV